MNPTLIYMQAGFIPDPFPTGGGFEPSPVSGDNVYIIEKDIVHAVLMALIFLFVFNR